MPQKIYFDTVAFRLVGQALGQSSLPDDLREKIVVSPLSAFEVLSQLTITKAEEVLSQIQSIHKWLNPERAGMLPWPDDVLRQLGFGLPMKEDDFTHRMGVAFDACLNATSAASLQKEAGNLKDTMDKIKSSTAEDFGRLVDLAKKESPSGDWFSVAWFQGVANRAKADPKSKSVDEIVTAFNAYHEFERIKLETALQSKLYSPGKHQNDLFDGEQLIYLGAQELLFLTCDKGFARVNKSAQFDRIKIVPPSDIANAQSVEKLLRDLVA
jgi:hypothetical protein